MSFLFQKGKPTQFECADSSMALLILDLEISTCIFTLLDWMSSFRSNSIFIFLIYYSLLYTIFF